MWGPWQRCRVVEVTRLTRSCFRRGTNTILVYSTPSTPFGRLGGGEETVAVLAGTQTSTWPNSCALDGRTRPAPSIGCVLQHTAQASTSPSALSGVPDQTSTWPSALSGLCAAAQLLCCVHPGSPPTCLHFLQVLGPEKTSLPTFDSPSGPFLITTKQRMCQHLFWCLNTCVNT